MRKPADSDFDIELEGVGRFRYARRTLGDNIAIRAKVARLTQGVGDLDIELNVLANLCASHAVLCVEAPAGWEDLESLDWSSGKDEQAFMLFAALRDKEESFRAKPSQGS